MPLLIFIYSMIGVADIQIWALLTRSQCRVSDAQVTVKACGPLVDQSTCQKIMLICRIWKRKGLRPHFIIFASQGFRSRSPLSSPLADCSADRHLAVLTGLVYKDDITFDQWVLLTVSWLGRCKMAEPSVDIFDCIHVIDC